MIKNKKSSCLKYWNVNNLHGETISQKLPVDSFKFFENTSQFNKDLIENYNEDSNEGYFLEVDVQFLKNYMNFTMIDSFAKKNENIENIEKLVANLYDKK